MVGTAGNCVRLAYRHSNENIKPFYKQRSYGLIAKLQQHSYFLWAVVLLTLDFHILSINSTIFLRTQLGTPSDPPPHLLLQMALPSRPCTSSTHTNAKLKHFVP